MCVHRESPTAERDLYKEDEIQNSGQRLYITICVIKRDVADIAACMCRALLEGNKHQTVYRSYLGAWVGETLTFHWASFYKA